MQTIPIQDTGTVVEGLIGVPILQQGWVGDGGTDGFQLFQPFGGYLQNDNTVAQMTYDGTQDSYQSANNSGGAFSFIVPAIAQNQNISGLLAAMLAQQSAGGINLTTTNNYNNTTNSYMNAPVGVPGGTYPGYAPPESPTTINNTYQTTNNVRNLKNTYNTLEQLIQNISTLQLTGSGIVGIADGAFYVITASSIFPASITGESTGSYAWAEQKVDNTTGAFSALTGGRSGTTSTNPAKEFNGTKGLCNSSTFYALMCEYTSADGTKFYKFHKDTPKLPSNDGKTYLLSVKDSTASWLETATFECPA
jgi:hypothetical protein